MSIKLCDILTLIDNKDYIDLHVYTVIEDGFAICSFKYDDLHKDDILIYYKIYFGYYIKFMYWYDNHLVLEIYRYE